MAPKTPSPHAERQIDLEDLIASRPVAGQPGGPNRSSLHLAEISAYASVQRQSARRRNAAEPRNTAPVRRVSPPLERLRTPLPEALEDAARQLVRLFLLAEQSPRVTQTFDSAPKGRHRDDLSLEIRDAKVLVEKMRAEWPPEFVRDILWFVTTVVNRADGTPMRFEDSGAEMLPGRSAEAQRWAGFGGLYRVLQAAAVFLARQRALGRGAVIPSTGDRNLLNSQLKILAQQRRDRDNR